MYDGEYPRAERYTGDTHAVSVTCSSLGKANAFQRVLWSFVESMDIRLDAPALEWSARNDAIVEHTYLRVQRHVRGGSDEVEDQVMAGHREEQLQANAKFLAKMLSGDWRLPTLKHHCWDCDLCRHAHEPLEVTCNKTHICSIAGLRCPHG